MKKLLKRILPNFLIGYVSKGIFFLKPFFGGFFQVQNYFLLSSICSLVGSLAGSIVPYFRAN
jgi:hypothetical protein